MSILGREFGRQLQRQLSSEGGGKPGDVRGDLPALQLHTHAQCLYSCPKDPTGLGFVIGTRTNDLL